MQANQEANLWVELEEEELESGSEESEQESGSEEQTVGSETPELDNNSSRPSSYRIMFELTLLLLGHHSCSILCKSFLSKLGFPGANFDCCGILQISH